MTAARARLVTTVAVLTLAAAGLVPGPAAVAAPAVESASDDTAAATAAASSCAAPTRPGVASCLTVVDPASPPATPRVTASDAAGPQTALAPVPDGITPAQLRAVYGTTGLTAPAGTTVGIVVAYDVPAVEADLASFRSTFGLPACTTANGCFRKVDQRGAVVPVGKPATTRPRTAPTDSAWIAETTLDTQAVSAMCPSCRILLVEADDEGMTTSLGPATLRAQTLGASVISNSFAATEDQTAAAADRDYWSKVTVPIFAGSGDHGYANYGGGAFPGVAYYPAGSPSVVSVGGTSATVSGNQLYNEQAWSSAGSGCAQTFARTAAQAAYFTAVGQQPDRAAYCQTNSAYAPVGGLPARASTDLSALADDQSPGFPLRLGGTWTKAGGTSLSVQLVAALAAYAGPRAAGTSVSDVLYGLAARGAPTGLVDVTAGANGTACAKQPVCTAGVGWDGPTGLGTPRGLSVFAPLLTVAPTTSVPGGDVTASGSNFVPGETVTVTAADGTVLATTTAAADGTYSVPVTLPTDDPSPVQLTVTGATSGFTANRSVLFGPPGLTLTPSTGTDPAVVPLERVTATLTNFTARERVTVSFPDGASASVVTTNAGTATTTVTVPADAQGSATATAYGTSSGASATATVPVAAPAAGPPFQAVVVGTTATVTVTGFGAGEPLTVTPAAGGDPVATGTAAGDGSGTVTWTTSGTTFGTSGLVVTGTTTGRTGTVYLNLLAAIGAAPDPPTVLSVVPTTAGGVLVGLRTAATGAAATSVTVLSSTGVLADRVPVTAGGDAFVTLDDVPAGTTLTVQALAGNAAGDSGLSVASLPVTADTGNGSGDLTPVGPVRLVDTRTTGGPLGANGTRVLPVAGQAGVPSTGVAAVVLSVTVVAPTAPTYLTLWPSGQARPVVSNANVGVGVLKASLVKVGLGGDGGVAVYNLTGSTQVVVDVVGFYAAGPDSTGRTVFGHNQSYAAGSGAPRLLDTRQLANSPFRTGAGQLVVPVRGRAGVPADATSVELTVQGVGAVGQGYLTVYPSTSPRPLASQVQYARGRPGVTAVLATLGSDGTVTVYANSGTEVIVDVVGYYSPSATGRFVPVSPRRYLDTRIPGSGGPVLGQSPRSVRLAGGTALDGSSQVPTTATAVDFSLTSTDNTAPQFVTAWPTGAAQPFATSLLPDPAQGIYDNLVLAGVGSGGAVSLAVNQGSVNLLVDVQGYFTAGPS